MRVKQVNGNSRRSPVGKNLDQPSVAQMLGNHIFSELHQPETSQAHFYVEASFVDCRYTVYRDGDFFRIPGEMHFAHPPGESRKIVNSPVMRQILRRLRNTVLFKIFR